MIKEICPRCGKEKYIPLTLRPGMLTNLCKACKKEVRRLR